MINTLIQFLTDLIRTIGYPGIALATFIESFFAPIPSELILPFAGFLAANGEMNVFIVGIVGATSSYLGTLPFYFIGKIGNKAKIKRLTDKYGRYIFISNEDVQKAFSLFERFGTPLVSFGRLIPIVRSLISLPAGMIHMNFLLFSGYTLAGALIWSYILAFGGFFLGDNWEQISKIISQYEHLVMTLGIVGILIFIGYRVWITINNFSKKKLRR